MRTCDQCDQPAVYQDVRIVNGIHNTIHLCQEHAIEAGLEVHDADFSILLHIQHGGTDNPSIKSCPDCGMNIPKYKETSLLGCPTCYETFRDQLIHVIARVQDNHIQHVGHSPKQLTTDMQRNLQIRRLLKELESEVNKENYEGAAKLRDQLKDLYECDDPNET